MHKLLCASVVEYMRAARIYLHEVSIEYIADIWYARESPTAHYLLVPTTLVYPNASPNGEDRKYHDEVFNMASTYILSVASIFGNVMYPP